MRAALLAVLLVGLAMPACTTHRVTVDPLEFKPIHLTVDINLKVDRDLDEFFDFEDEFDEEGDPVEEPEETEGGRS